MTETYEVVHLGEVRNWTSTKGGPMLAYRIDLRSLDGTIIHDAEWSRKPDSPAPAIGQSIEGDIEQTNYGPKFRPAQQPGGARGGGRSIAERHEIAMQHAQKCAVTILELAATQGDYRPPTVAEVTAQAKTIAAALFEQIRELES